MAKIPAKTKKPAAKSAKHFVPPVTLKPGQKKKISVKAIKAKLEKLQSIREELEKIQRTQSLAGGLGRSPTMFSNKALTDKMSEFHEMLDAEEVNLSKQLAIAQKEAKEEPNIGPIIKVIEKECSQALAVYKKTGEVLLRGASSKTNPPLFHGRSRINRSTLHSSAGGQQIYDHALKKFGITALRSNSIFTSSDPHQAKDYGDAIYVIIPKNGFEFSWALYEPDLVIDDLDALFHQDKIERMESNIDKYIQANKNKLGSKLKNAKGYLWVNALMDKGFDASIKYLRSIGYPDADKITLDNLIDYKSIKDDMGPTNKNFDKAVSSGHEVLISGEYYGINIRTYKEILTDIMGLKLPQLERTFD